MSRPIESLISLLRQQVLAGQSHVVLDETSRETMRRLFIHFRQKQKAPQARHRSVADVLQDSSMSLHLNAEGKDKLEKLSHLKELATRWKPALELGTLSKSMVFGVGSPNSSLVFITDTIGYHEEKSKQPLAGEAWQKFVAILKAMGLQSQDVYITSLTKFRPQAPRQVTNTRTPTPEEIQACLPILIQELEIIKPQCIVLLGSSLSQSLLQLEFGIGAGRDQWHEWQGIPTRTTYHPSLLLSSQSHDKKRELWEDMLAVMEQLEMAITEKQRNYFRN